MGSQQATSESPEITHATPPGAAPAGSVRTVSWRALPAHSLERRGQSILPGSPSEDDDLGGPDSLSDGPSPDVLGAESIRPLEESEGEGFASSVATPSDALFLTTGVTYEPLPPPLQVTAPGRHGARRRLSGEGPPPPLEDWILDGRVPPPLDQEILEPEPLALARREPLAVTLLPEAPFPHPHAAGRRGPSPALLVAMSVFLTALFLIPLQLYLADRPAPVATALAPAPAEIAPARALAPALEAPQADPAAALTEVDAEGDIAGPPEAAPSAPDAQAATSAPEASAPVAVAALPTAAATAPRPQAPEPQTSAPGASAPKAAPASAPKTSTASAPKAAPASAPRAAPASPPKAAPASAPKAVAQAPSRPAPLPSAAAQAPSRGTSQDEVARLLRGEPRRPEAAAGAAPAVDVTDLLVAGAPPGAALPLRLYHLPPPVTREGMPISLRTQGGPATAATLHWRVDGGAYRHLPMTPAGQDTFKASITLPEGERVEYYFEAQEGEGAEPTFLRRTSPYTLVLPEADARSRRPAPVSF